MALDPQNPILAIGENQRELVLLTGKAAPIREYAPTKFTGTIGAPWAFLEKKLGRYQPEHAHVRIDRDNAALTLTLRDNEELQDVIGGKLTPDTDAAPLGINVSGKLFTVAELRKVIKPLRYLFADADEHGRLLRQLEQFSATITRNLDDHKDNRGNAKKSVETAVSGVALPDSFVLRTRVFKGEQPLSYRVELGYDVTDAGTVSLYLESAELLLLAYQEREELLGKAAEPFKEWGCSIVWIS